MNRGNGINSLFIFLLLGVYTLLMLLVVITGAKTYSRIVTASDQNDALRASVMYITGKVRGCDEEGAVSVIDVDGTDVLTLKSILSDTSYTTYIYLRDDSICEYFSLSERDFDASLGERISAAERLTFSLSNGLLRADVTASGSFEHVFISLRGDAG